MNPENPHEVHNVSLVQYGHEDKLPFSEYLRIHSPMTYMNVCLFMSIFCSCSQHLSSTLNGPGVNLDEEHPLVDYTPPHLITYLFTDMGILVPSAVSDTLIKLYL